MYSWPDFGLPTDYWERPASLEHREWWPILGGWPGTGYDGTGWGPIWDQLYPDTNPRWSPIYDFHPWVQGPNTSHIVWKRQETIAGVIGGPTYHYGTTSSPGNPSLVYAGRCYQTVTKVVNGTETTVLQSYDIRTGEVYFESYPLATVTTQGFFGPRVTPVSPQIISYNEPGPGSVPGAEAQTTYSVELLAIAGSTLFKFDPLTGAASEYDISPISWSSGTSVYYTNQRVKSIQNLGGGEYRLIEWSTAGSSNNFASRVISNTTYAKSSWVSTTYEDSATAGYRYHTYPHIDFNVGIGVTVAAYGWNGPTRVYEAYKLQGYDLETGTILWNVTVDEPIDEPIYSRSCYVADHGKIAILTQNGYFNVYNLADGHLAYKSETMDYPWASAGFGAYAIESAYGMFFRQAYDGVYAFDWDDGSIVWKYKAPSPVVNESPYIDEEGNGVYPFNGGAMIADGKMYVYNTEHTASWPMTRGWGLHCINITNGELVWKIGNPMAFGAVADGYLTAANSWDGYMYVFGKGKTETTVTAPDVAVPAGTTLTIKGTVLDISPAQPGTPCVSKDSMSLQMEYLHLQRPINGIWENETMTGVPVTLTAIDEDGSVTELGTTTTNGYYGTFALPWTPTEEGTYEIIASFAGDDSYGSSGAATAVTVGPTPSSDQEPETEPSTTEEPPTAEPTTTEEPTSGEPSTTEQPSGEPLAFPTTEVIIVATVAVAVVIGIGAYWAIKKFK